MVLYAKFLAVVSGTFDFAFCMVAAVVEGDGQRNTVGILVKERGGIESSGIDDCRVTPGCFRVLHIFSCFVKGGSLRMGLHLVSVVEVCILQVQEYPCLSTKIFAKLHKSFGLNAKIKK